jgi:hypothetical protein
MIEGHLHVDRPLGVVADGEGEDNGADMAGCATGGDRAGGKSTGLRKNDGARGSRIKEGGGARNIGAADVDSGGALGAAA